MIFDVSLLPLIHHIDSADDPRVVAFRDVRQHSVGVSSSPWIVAEGHRVVRRSCASRYAVQKILATEHCVDQYAQHAGHGIEVYAAPKRLISEIVGYDFHRSVLAVVHRPAMVGLSEFRQRLQIDQPPPVILAAVEVTEQENLGSMIRTAAAMGICDVLCVGTLDPLSRRVLRVSMGAALAINLFQIPQVDHFGEWLRQRNFDRVRCLAATPAGNSIPIADYVKKSQSDAESSPAGRPV
ncbi:MAG: TrmH family RNA methyltransferase, partial [Planctomycetota bacterium]